MTVPQNATEVARALARLARELDDTVGALHVADEDATRKRVTFDLAYSKAFVAAQGSVDQRKHLAVIETHPLRDEAEVADSLVRHLRRRLDALRVRIDVGRSYGAAIRAELALAGSDGAP